MVMSGSSPGKNEGDRAHLVVLNCSVGYLSRQRFLAPLAAVAVGGLASFPAGSRFVDGKVRDGIDPAVKP